MWPCNVCCCWWKWEIGFRIFGTISYTFEMCKGSDFQRRVLHYSSSFGLRCLLVHQSHSPKVINCVRNVCLSLRLLLRFSLAKFTHCWSNFNSMRHNWVKCSKLFEQVWIWVWTNEFKVARSTCHLQKQDPIVSFI